MRPHSMYSFHSITSFIPFSGFGAKHDETWNIHAINHSEFRRSLKTFLFGQWGQGTVWTVLTAPSINIRTYLLTYLLTQLKYHISYYKVQLTAVVLTYFKTFFMHTISSTSAWFERSAVITRISSCFRRSRMLSDSKQMPWSILSFCTGTNCSPLPNDST